jgi:hypothetical protein
MGLQALPPKIKAAELPVEMHNAVASAWKAAKEALESKGKAA